MRFAREIGQIPINYVSRILAFSANFESCLARVLRLLSTEFIFREVSPDVFANNRVSSILDTGKNSSDLLAKYLILIAIQRFD